MKLAPLFLTGLSVLFTACGSNVKLELKNASSLSRVAVRGATDQTSDVTIESLKIPIFDVGLSYGDELFGSSNSAIVYQCAGSTAADCQVELVGNALENLLTGGGNSGSLSSGKTYASVMIGTCNSTVSSYTATIKATASVGGVTYYTKTGANYMTSTQADYSPVELTFGTCRNYTVLSQPLVYDGSALTLSLYIDLRNIAHAFGSSSSLFSSANGSMSCTVPSGTTPSGSSPYLCVDFPDVGGTTKTGTPTVERYKLTNTAVASATSQLIGIYFDSDGEPIGGYNRAYLADVTGQTTLLNTPNGFKKATLSGTDVVFSDYSGGATDTANSSGTLVTNYAASTGDFTVMSFPRPALGAAAENITSITKNDGSTASVAYTVSRIAD